MKKLTVVITFLVGLGIVGYFLLSANPGQQPLVETTVIPDSAATQEVPVEKPEVPETETVTVTYDETGFSPKEVTISKGTTINFVNNSEIPLWAATDPHPDHTDYPEFDTVGASENLPQPGNDYSFTFDKSGVWGYHNHTQATHTGTVTVQ